MAAVDIRAGNRHASSGVYTNAAQVVAWLVGTAIEAEVRAQATVMHFTTLLETRVKANASGRPGPRAPNGDYRRSINGEVTRDKGNIIGTVGTNAPQSRRLEYGFVGPDSLGRVYNQPPYEHFGPADALTSPEFVTAMRALAASLGRVAR